MAVQDGYGKSSGSESLVFAYDLKDTINSYRGEPATNLVATIASYHGGNVSTSYANGQYQTSAIVINGVDNTVPSGNFSQVSGTTTDTNSQTYWTIQGNAVVNESNQTVSFSVYLKGNGTCHLATYNDQCCYQVGPDITLTSTWTRYSITKSLTTFADYHWVAVRGITTSTNVFISSAQWERNSHSTPFTPSSRSNTQGLLDLTGNSSIDLSNVSFDSNAQITLDGTDDGIDIGAGHTTFTNKSFAVETILYPNTSPPAVQVFFAAVGPVGGLQKNIHFRIYNSGAYRMGFYSNDLDTAAGVVTFGGYNHVVMQYDYNLDTSYIYVNGQLNVSGSQGPFTDSSAQIGVGYWPGSGQYFSGEIPVVKIYNRTLTSTEISNNYLKYKRQYGLT